MDSGIMVPIVMFICIALAVILSIWFKYRFRTQVQVTVRSAIEKGQELTPEILERLGETKKPKNADLRKGMMYVAVAIGIALFGTIIGAEEEDAEGALLAISCIPALIGIAYLLLWKLDKGKDDEAISTQ